MNDGDADAQARRATGAEPGREGPTMQRRWCVDGQWHSLAITPLTPLLEVLREDLAITGPKEGCGEGECGACTVLLDDAPVLACLLAAGQIMDGSRIDTIATVAETPLGRRIIDAFAVHGAVQCGACIPGMIVSAYAYLRDVSDPTPDGVREALSGNLCRCTGYTKIVSAVLAAAGGPPTRAVPCGSEEAHPGAPPATPPREAAPDRGTAGVPDRSPAAPQANTDSPDGRRSSRFHGARTLGEALAFRAQHPGCTVLAGGTDLMVGWNAVGADALVAGELPPESAPARTAAASASSAVLCLTHIPDLRGVTCDRQATLRAAEPRADGARERDTEPLRRPAAERERLVIGSCTSVAALLRDPQVARHAPALAAAAGLLGARPIREQATIGGNIANASPAADLVPPLLVAGAAIEIRSLRGVRHVPLAEFFRGYKRIDLADDEIITAVHVPALAEDEREGYRKLGTRRAQAIAKVAVAARLRLEAGRISEIELAAASVAPTALRLVRTARRLHGEALQPSLIARAREWAAAEVSPIDDLRSTAAYRRAMTGVLVADLLGELCAAR